MIKVRILKAYYKDELGKIAGFVVKDDTTYAIVILGNELLEFELNELEVENG